MRTAVAPTWEDISKLAVIATIRTMLNYFLAKDIAAFERQTGAKAKRLRTRAARQSTPRS